MPAALVAGGGPLTARIEGVPEARAGVFLRLAYRFAKRMVGKVPEPLTVAAHHGWIFRAYTAFEFLLQRARLVDRRLKALAELRAATMIGCAF